MSTPCTKICSVSTVLDIDPGDPESSGSKLWRAFVDEVGRTKGFRSMQYGYRLDAPHILQWMIGVSCPKTFELVLFVLGFPKANG